MATETIRLPYKRRVNHQAAKEVRKRHLSARPQSPKEADSESVKTECLGRGYRILGKTLGEGAYAKVILAEVSSAKLARSKALADTLDGHNPCVAIKVINKKAVPKEFLRKFLPRELDNHFTLPHHPNVVQVFENFSTQDQVFLVLEYCEKGDLLDHINKAISNKQRGLGEDITKKIFKQLCNGVQHIHNHSIVHRDLKCENILITADTTVKITDFGFSCRFEDRNLMLKTSCGSYAYTAPEVIKSKPYDGYRADIWSMGIILFAMVNGRLPYNDNQLTEMDEDMRMQRLRFERNVSFDCMVLIRKMLQYNPLLRPSIQEVLSEVWITGKKPIPRQINKPKWINPYSANKDGGNSETDKLRIDGAASEKSSPLCYRGDSTERSSTGCSPQATVTINQNTGDTVTLKSRIKPQIRQPIVPRPQTWPKTEKEQKSENERLPKRRGKTAPPRKPDNSQASARLTQLLELTKNSKQRQEAGRAHRENGIPLWYMYKIIEHSNKQSDGKPSQSEERRISSCKTGSRQVVRHTVSPASPRKRYQVQNKNTQKHGGTVKFHIDANKSLLMEKLLKAGEEQEMARESQGDTVPTATKPTQPPPEHTTHMCRDRFLSVYGPTTPQYVKEFPLPPLMVQRMEIQESNGKAKQWAERRKPCSAPATGNTSPEPAAVPSSKGRAHKGCQSAVRPKPVYKVVYHAG